jgi:hypothetical protein
MNMLPPNHLYTANILNSTDKAIEVTVHYKNPDRTDSKTEKVEPGAQHLFGEVTYNKDTSTHIVPVDKIVVHTAGDNASQSEHQPKVSGIHRVKTFQVTSGSSGLNVAEQQL